jgi:hypothetical protein
VRGSACCLLGLFFDPEDGSSKVLPNVELLYHIPKDSTHHCWKSHYKGVQERPKPCTVYNPSKLINKDLTTANIILI